MGDVKYKGLVAKLTREILAGKFVPLGAFPSERALAVRFGVSRQTIRRVMRELNRTGLVYSKQGKGTKLTRIGANLRESVGLILTGERRTEIVREIREELTRLAGRMGLSLLFGDASALEARLRGDATVPLWGTGKPLREFLHVDDLAEACLFALGLESPPDLMNVGSGEEVSIRGLAETVRVATGCSAELVWNSSKPDGTPRKLCDTALIRSLGWKPQIPLKDGIVRTVDCYRRECASGRVRLERA